MTQMQVACRSTGSLPVGFGTTLASGWLLGSEPTFAGWEPVRLSVAGWQPALRYNYRPAACDMTCPLMAVFVGAVGLEYCFEKNLVSECPERHSLDFTSGRSSEIAVESGIKRHTQRE